MICGLGSISLQSLVSSILILSTVTAANTNPDLAPIVDLGYVRYQGYFDVQTNSTNFLNVRYAAPPLGNLRFQAPQSPAFEPGVQSASQNLNMCYQVSMGENTTALVSPHGFNKRQSTTPVISEDCLFLGVFVPGNMSTKPVGTGGFPVLVWIHGGGYVAGNTGGSVNANFLVDSLNTVIVVAIQYRLGVFGFLSGNEVKAQGALNAGLLDQQFALQWVQDHIELFGGDKTRVTIWGGSSGGGSVLQHVIANGGNTQPPLFNAAMVNSPYSPPQYYYNDRLPELLYNKVVSISECASSANSFVCLQSADAEALQVANSDIGPSVFASTPSFSPVVDGTFIVERPTVTLAKGQVNGKVLLALSNQNEGNIFVNPNETSTIMDYVTQLFPDMSLEQVQEAVHIYEEYGTASEQATLAFGDSMLACPTYYLLSAFAGRSWKGLFAIPPAYHSDDLVYYLRIPGWGPPPYNNTQFIEAFAQSFMSVVKYDDVNKKFDPTNITPTWNKYNIGETEMMFNRTEDGKPDIVPIKTDAKLLQRCAFWSTVTSATAQ